jgi:hypothetical protein
MARVERYRQVTAFKTDPAEVERINLLIVKLYAERVRLHQNPEK